MLLNPYINLKINIRINRLDMGLIYYTPLIEIKYILAVLAFIAGLCVITTKNAIISVFNLIVLYILVAFYLIHIGITYIGISYVVVYIGAIAILFLFVIMMIDVEVIEKKNNNYLLLLFFLLGGFLYTLKNILYNLGLLKIKNIFYKEEIKYFSDFENDILFSTITQIYNNEMNLLTNPIFEKGIKNTIIEEGINNYNYYKSNLNLNYQLDISTISNWLSILKNKSFTNNDILFNNLDYTIQSNQTNILLIVPDWDSAFSNISQISAVGEVLYSTYNAYIYIVSIILLLAMLGAIILTADYNQETKFLTIVRKNIKTSNIFSPLFLIYNLFTSYIFINPFYKNKNIKNNLYSGSLFGITPFYENINNNIVQSENIIGNLPFYIVSNIIIGLLLLTINYYFSISVKYLDKGGGFECGFTSFIQTRERYNIAFYRVSLLFLVFDLEIILAFPFPAILQKDENLGKNNILVFLFVLIVGFIYELKEGALNIVKTTQSIEVKVIDE